MEVCVVVSVDGEEGRIDLHVGVFLGGGILFLHNVFVR